MVDDDGQTDAGSRPSYKHALSGELINLFDHNGHIYV